MKKIITIIHICASSFAFSQVQGLDFYSYRLNNQLNSNPAYTNYSEGFTIFTNGMAQGSGVASNMKNFSLGMYSKLSNKQGLGGGIITDSRGAFGTSKAYLSYAYTLPFNTNTRLHLGLNAGAINNSLNQNRIEGIQYADITDPTLTKDYFNRTQFISGVGTLFQWKKLDIGLALPHLLATNSNVLPYFNANTQYTFNAGTNFKVIPSVMYQYVPNLGSVVGVFVQGDYKNRFWVRAGYQSRMAVYAMAGIKVENVSIAYSYRINTGLFRNIAGGNHEVGLSINIGKRGKKSLFNPTLTEIDFRLSKLLNKKISKENKEVVAQEINELRKLLENTEINNSTPEASNEANALLSAIQDKFTKLETKLNEN